jgi:hypothetical protein
MYIGFLLVVFISKGFLLVHKFSNHKSIFVDWKKSKLLNSATSSAVKGLSFGRIRR